MRHRSRARATTAVLGVMGLVLGLAACSTDASIDVHLPDQVDASFSADIQQQFETAVDTAIAASGASGAIVGVWAPWAGTWVQGVGTVTPGGAAVTTDMTIPAGPLTRAMTCDVLYGMTDRGIVHLEDKVTDWVSGIPGFEDVTLGQLCDSTAGIPSYTDAIQSRLLAAPERVWLPRELISYGMADGHSADPGSSFVDSDTGYVLLGMALTRASRQSNAELYRDYVTAPLSLGHTGLPATSGVTFTGLWTPDADGAVACTEPEPVEALSPSAGSTAYGVETTIDELGKYTQALALQALSYDDEQRFTDGLPADPLAPAWYTATGGAYQAGSLIGQFGSLPGHLVAAYADRNTGMTVAVVLNNSRADDTLVRSLAWQLAAIASKAPAAAGGTTPDGGLPWTAEEQGGRVPAAAICPIPEG